MKVYFTQLEDKWILDFFGTIIEVPGTGHNNSSWRGEAPCWGFALVGLKIYLFRNKKVKVII